MGYSLRGPLERALRIIGVLLYRAHLHRAIITARRRRVRVVGYHACQEEENDWIAGLASNTPPADLRTHIAYLCEHYTVISLEQLERGDLPDRPVLLTFDDGYRSVYLDAYPILRARGLPATVYVLSSAVDNRAMVWVNELNWFMRRHRDVTIPIVTSRLGLPATSDAEEVLAVLSDKYDRTLVTSLLVEIRRRTGVNAEALAVEADLYLTWDQIREMAQHGVSFGNHTATHPNLSRLSDADQRSEMSVCRDALQAHGLQCTSLALPFGVAGPASRRLAAELGHRSVMEVGGGNQKLDLLRVGRHFPDASTEEELFAELEVVAPIVSWWRRLQSRRRG